MWRTALDQLHGHEVDVLVAAALVDGNDIGVVERGGRLRFLNEARPALGVPHLFGGKDLKSYQPVEAGVAGFRHHAHAARAERFEDFKVGELARDRRLGIGLHHTLVRSCASGFRPSL